MLCKTAADTEALGEKLAKTLRPEDIVWLYGDLGAGKTAFVRGMARGLGISATVTSPTYTIVNEYPGRLPLFHFDLYRLTGLEDLYGVGWEDYLSRGGVCAAEWAQRLGAPPEPGILVHMSYHEEGRRVEIDYPDNRQLL